MTDSPHLRGLSTTGAPALETHPTRTPTPTEPHRLHFLRLEQHAPRGIGVKDLRPLRGRALPGPILDPDALLDAAHKQAENEQEKINDKNRGVDRPRSFRDDRGDRTNLF